MKKKLLVVLSLLLASCGSVENSSSINNSNSVSESSSEEIVFNIEDYIQTPDELMNYKDLISMVSSLGTINDFTYTYNGNEKIAKVYTPWNYDSSDNFDTLYLMHSFNGSETTYIDAIDIASLLDYMIFNRDIKPMIVVMPTWNVNGVSPAEGDIYKEFPKELAYIVDEVEKNYKTYKGDDVRNHRICGGYSMGGITTWSVFIHYFDMFKTYINMSGYMWEKSKLMDEKIEKKNLELIESTLDAANNKEFVMYNYVGGQDFVNPYLLALLNKCGESKYFDFTSNVTIKVSDSAEHNTAYSNIYLADALKAYFKK